MVALCHNVRHTHNSVHTITKSAKSRTKVYVLQEYHSALRMNHTQNYRYVS